MISTFHFIEALSWQQVGLEEICTRIDFDQTISSGPTVPPLIGPNVGPIDRCAFTCIGLSSIFAYQDLSSSTQSVYQCDCLIDSSAVKDECDRLFPTSLLFFNFTNPEAEKSKTKIIHKYDYNITKAIYISI